MTEDVYEPPKSELISESEARSNSFYVVSKTKLTVLFLATIGIYTLYWFYINWRNYKAATDENLMPIVRALFYIFFTHSLFIKIDFELSVRKLQYNWWPGLLATVFVILSIVSNVLDRLSAREIGSPMTDVASLIILPVMLLVLLKAQEAINLSQDDRYGESNSSFTVYNYLWIVLGVVLWLLIAIGLIEILGQSSL